MSSVIVVLGSNSFSGAHFVDFCLAQGLQVIGISRSPEPHQVFLPYKRNRSLSNFTFFELDINNAIPAIVDLIRASRAAYVVNFAAQSMVAQSWEKPGDWFQTNTLATVLLHDELRKCQFLKKYVHISTPEVYGSCSGMVAEHTAYNPSTPYAVSRAAADMSLASFYQAYGFPVVFTRAANVYGPSQQLYRIIPITVLNFMIGEKVCLHGGGHSLRSFVHIRDVVAGTFKVMTNAVPPEIFHLATAKNISIYDLVGKIAAMMRVSFADNVEIVGERLGKDAAYLLDSGKVRKELGWSELISLEQGLTETIKWVADNLEILRKMPRRYIHKR